MRGRHVHNAVAESALGACTTIMLLVGVQDGYLTRQAALDSTSVIKGLHAEVGDSDAIGVVPMRREASAAEACLQQLDAVDRPATAHPIAARSFKTFVRRPV